MRRAARLRSILDELVRPLKLAWTYHDESLLITSASEAESDSMQSARVYSLADFPAYRNRRGEGIPDYENMIDTITNAVSPKTWQDNGGCGTIAKVRQGRHSMASSSRRPGKDTWRSNRCLKGCESSEGGR